MAKNYYLSGQWNVTCDVCSKKIKSSEAKQRWDGFITCPSCWEHRQPLDFIRARTDKIVVPFQRPIPTLEFVPQAFEEPLTDLVITDEHLQRTVAYIRSYGDSVSFADTARLTMARPLSDTVSLLDVFAAVRSIDLADTVLIVDEAAKTVSIPKTDIIVINDSITKVYGLNPTDIKSIVDTEAKNLFVFKTDSVSPIDGLVSSGATNSVINGATINASAINAVIPRTITITIAAINGSTINTQAI